MGQGRAELTGFELELGLLSVLGYSPRPDDIARLMGPHQQHHIHPQSHRRRAMPLGSDDAATATVTTTVSGSKTDHPDESQLEVITRQRFHHITGAFLSVSNDDESIRQAFVALDSSCAGFISLSDFKAAVAEELPHLSDYVTTSAFRRVDTDRDGRVGYREFEAMMRLQVE